MIASMAWCAASLAAVYGYWLVMTNFVIRDFWDPTYVQKMELLKARLAEYPGRPLWLVLGSSHVHDALAPEALPEKINDGKSPLLFNFGSSGADLFYQLVCLRRLLAEGIKPGRVGLEFDPMLNGDYSEFAGNPALIPRARRDELDDFLANSKDPAALRGTWLDSRWNPFFEYGMRAPGQALVLRLVPFLSRLEDRPGSKWGWYQVAAPHPSKEKFEAMLPKKESPDVIRPPLMPNADRALRGMIALCEQKGIAVFLLRTPEAEGARESHSPKSETDVQQYLDALARDHHVQIIDTRAWMTDDEFFDPHHLDATGAVRFTQKLAGILYPAQ